MSENLNLVRSLFTAWERGDELMTKGASVFFITGARVTRLELYWDRARALADLGLAE